MKLNLFLLLLVYSISSYSQCFDCGQSIGGHVEDVVLDIDKASDGIILIYTDQSSNSTIRKYDFDCNVIWTNNVLAPSGMFIRDATIDNNDNIYTVVSNYGNNRNINGVVIEQGSSLVRLNANGDVEWAKKFSDEKHLNRKIHIWMNNLFVVGQIDQSINTNIGLTIPNGYGSQYFAAKYDLAGNLIDSEHFGGNYNETFFDSQIDENGNIYLTGFFTDYTNHISHLYKINSSLDLVWSQELSNNPAERSFQPMTIYYNTSNQKLYVWAKYKMAANFYNNSITVSNDCTIGSVIMEISKINGDLDNYTVIDNCGFLQSVGNGIGSVEQRSFLTHEGSNLYILSSFRNEIEIGDQTLSTSQTIHNDYNVDLILHKIDLTNFSSELILRSTGEQYYDSSPYYDLAGPIVAHNGSIHMSSSFMSFPMTINGNIIDNNSGNNARDVLYYKHILDKTDAEGVISIENTCVSDVTEFEINGDFDSIIWDFDDPTSGTDNTSTLNNPSHIFTTKGTYSVTAEVTCGTESEIIHVEVVITDTPMARQIPDIYACEDVFGGQISNSFDTSSIENDLIGNQLGVTIKYFDGNGVELPSPLPNPMSNTLLGQETIIARVAYTDNLTCFTEVQFDLIVNSIPEITTIGNLYVCDDDYDGISEFDLSNVTDDLLNGQTGMLVEFFHEDGQQLPNPLPNTIFNTVSHQETIMAKITDLSTNCFLETTFDLVVHPLPVANPLEILNGCDDNDDGISEYFDTSNIETQVLNGQTGKRVTYFDQDGNQLPSPLPNPYTNTIMYNEHITVRVTDNVTTCFAETILELKTSAQPKINQPDNLYSCDLGNGYSEFDTSNIEQQLIGNQSGLEVTFYDSDKNLLPSPLPILFQNTEPFSQTIGVRVENATNSICYSETSFDLIVTALPEIDLEDEYFICNLEPSISLNVNPGFDSYRWTSEGGTQISDTNNAEIVEEGSYTLTVNQDENGIVCENVFNFKLVRSVPPVIEKVNHGELGNNFIEIIASGDGDFEYSIDGINYQDSNYFSNVHGGSHTVFVRDKEGCGEDSDEITLIDYPKFFTPNNDGYNDFWHIHGIEAFPDLKVFIFDRYGKLLTQLSSFDLGWDGFYNNEKMMPSDYWFKADLGNGRIFSGHFSLTY